MFDILKLVSFALRISRRIRRSRLTIGTVVVTGILSGLGYPLMIAIIGAALARQRETWLLPAFLALCVLVPTNRLASQAMFNWFGARTVFELRLQLCHRILVTPLRDLERLGSPRLFASLTEDAVAISNAFILIPLLISQLGIITAGLFYMAWLSPRVFLPIAAFLALGIASYHWTMVRSRRYVDHLREESDELFARFRGLIQGIKELKLNHRRRQSFVARDLMPTSDRIRKLTFVSNTLFTASTIFGQLLFFVAIGLLVFIPARLLTPDLQVLTSFTLILLFIRTPVEVVYQSLPVLSRARAAADKVERLGLELEAQSPEPRNGPMAAAGWRSLEMAGVVHRYEGQEREAFQLGPIDLVFRPGELVFLVGGNGSGKTTLAKVLTGLYPPDQGSILLDGREVAAEGRDAYRQLFSAVFPDFFLFDRLVGKKGADLDAMAEPFLARLELAGKVRVEGGVLSTVDLSQGQRKRLALLHAYLEDRPIYLFDEWAADQDPHYKAIFYLELLPELKARGKTVFVISHDDHYYAVADRLIKLTSGCIEEDVTRSERAPWAEWSPDRASAARPGLPYDRNP